MMINKMTLTLAVMTSCFLLGFPLSVAPFVSQAKAEKHSDHQGSKVYIHHGWVRASIGKAKNSAAYMVIGNPLGKPDQLVSASSPAAKTVEIHTHTTENGVMRMRQMPSLDVPAKGHVELKPGGHHIMLIGLTQPLKDGDKIDITFTFKGQGIMKLQFPVKSSAPANSHQEHMKMQKDGNKQMPAEHDHRGSH